MHTSSILDTDVSRGPHGTAKDGILSGIRCLEMLTGGTF